MHLLDNLVQMTGQRDHLRLELSVLSTFLELPHIQRVRALELQTLGDRCWFRPRTWSDAGQLHTTDQLFHQDAQRQALDNLPALRTCLAEQRPQASASLVPGSHTLWLPVWLHSQVHACLEVTQSEPFTPASLDVITGVFNVYRNYQSLLDYSERDALTGLLNRKTFDEHLLRFTVPSRTSSPTSAWLAVIDIDHFKSVNDRFGHLFGDEVLILVANVLRQCFGAENRIFRFGGEEFVVLLPSMSHDEAVAALERFRTAVASYAFPQLEQVTVSIGFAGMQWATPVELLGHADQALYYAKSHGRNCIQHYQSLQSQGLLQPTQIAHADVELF